MHQISYKNTLNSKSRQFHTKVRTINRIGPHNLDVISVLVGCLLGDGYASQSKAIIKGTSFRFKQSDIHKDYLFFLSDFFFIRGYCTSSGPRKYKTILINASNEKKILWLRIRYFYI